IALKRGFNFTDDFTIKKPGAYQFRAVIRDPETSLMGSAGQFIQVPDLSKKRLEISGLVLISTEPEPTQTPGPPGQAATDGSDDIQPTPNVRRFSRNSVIDFGAFAYNSTLDPKTGKPQLSVQVEIYSDGKVLHQLAPRQLDQTALVDPNRIECSGRI